MNADIVSDHRVQAAALRRYDLYASTSQADQCMLAAGSDVVGTLPELLSKVGVVADCTPKKVAAANKLAYQEARVKSVLPDLDVVTISGKAARTDAALGVTRDFLRAES